MYEGYIQWPIYLYFCPRGRKLQRLLLIEFTNFKNLRYFSETALT